VIATDERVARWARRPIRTLHPGVTFAPLVLGPAQIPKIRDDFTLSFIWIDNLQDLSSLVSPSLAYSATEWMTLSIYGFVPVRGLRSLAAKETYSELSLSPMKYRALFEARIFY
jgi:hypothetical protein